MSKPATTPDPDRFYRELLKCIRYQGVRLTARRAGWHPSRVHRALHDFGRICLRDAIVLALAVDAPLRFTVPTTTRLRQRVTGRPGADCPLPF